MSVQDPGKDTMAKLNRLAKWRMIFAGWQLGTRSKEDPECQAVRDHREAMILLRCEVTALIGLCIEKGVFSREEWTSALGEEAVLLAQDYEKRWPGVMATDVGLSIDLAQAEPWLREFKP